MARAKKVARMTLRLDADVHRQIEEVGRLMHLDNNDVVHLLVHRGLGKLRTEAVLADYLREVSPAQLKKLFDNWRTNVGREPPAFLFFEELNKLALNKPNVLDGSADKPSETSRRRHKRKHRKEAQPETRSEPGRPKS